MNIKEASELMSVSPVTVMNRLNARGIDYKREGRTYVFDDADFVFIKDKIIKDRYTSISRDAKKILIIEYYLLCKANTVKNIANEMGLNYKFTSNIISEYLSSKDKCIIINSKMNF